MSYEKAVRVPMGVIGYFCMCLLQCTQIVSPVHSFVFVHVVNMNVCASDTAGGLFGNGGIYGGCIQDAVGNFAKKGLTFWSRDLFVAAFVQLLGRRPVK